MSRAGKRLVEDEQLHLFIPPSSSEAPTEHTQQVNPAPTQTPQGGLLPKR